MSRASSDTGLKFNGRLRNVYSSSRLAMSIMNFYLLVQWKDADIRDFRMIPRGYRFLFTNNDAALLSFNKWSFFIWYICIYLRKSKEIPWQEEVEQDKRSQIMMNIITVIHHRKGWTSILYSYNFYFDPSIVFKFEIIYNYICMCI